jgi:hypothetical protein
MDSVYLSMSFDGIIQHKRSLSSKVDYERNKVFKTDLGTRNIRFCEDEVGKHIHCAH